MGDLFKSAFGVVALPLILAITLGIIYFMFIYMDIDPRPSLALLAALTPILLPIGIFHLLFEKWMEAVRLGFVVDNGRTTLRLKLPQEVFKSPEAMESVFAQIYNPNGPDNLWQTYLDGKHPLTFSFELVSHGGEVRFYINVPTKKTKNAVEAQLYAQYPGIEVIEEPLDYTAEITWNPEKYEMMAFHVTKKEDQIFPIKTYIDFGLDKLPKEEEKFEPMAAMIEQLGKAKPHERIWVQILAVPHAKKNFANGSLHEKGTWEKDGYKKIDEIVGRGSAAEVGEDGTIPQARLTPGDRDLVAAMERNLGKYAYEVAIRWLYITQKGKFNGDFIGPMLRTFSQYDIIKRNGLSPRWRTDFNYNWFSDFSGKRKLQLKKEELQYYKLRAYETRDKKTHTDSPKVMSVEELATIYHIPGSSIISPALPRIMSTRKTAPPNLPTGIGVNL